MSGSDDCQIIISNPHTNRTTSTIQSGHQGNIFSVKFVSSDNTVASGAADGRVQVYDVARTETKLICSCHRSRVKRLDVPRNERDVFLSAAEDGMILSYDLRERHICNNAVPKNLLINLNTIVGPNAEAKCLTINPLQPELVAVGANDPYIRLFDRRMIREYRESRASTVSFKNN